jgi:hypothetical protein
MGTRSGFLVVAALLARTAPLPAQGLVSPGPLTTAHARYDNIQSCLTCHETGRELSGRKCLACHVALAAQIRAGRGYHATATRNGAELRCAACHSEHNGRPYRLVRWPNNVAKEQFDHARTGFTLEGAHARGRCEECHKAGFVSQAAVRGDSSLSVQRTFLGLDRTCASCHLDEHRGRTDSDCLQCHTQDAWKPVPRFDHSRTHFPLEGRHEGVACARCHETRRENATGPGGATDTSFVDFRAGRRASAGCTSCHVSPHRDASRTSRCEACHTVDGWFVMADSLRTFDHTAIGFPLRGAHALARCENCHLASQTAPLTDEVALVRANFLRPLARAHMAFARCTDCHADVHGAELRTRGRDCSACHDEAAFTPTRFTAAMHDSTTFPLTGAHGAVPCAGCHEPLRGATAGSGRIRFRRTDTACLSCHRDPHGGQFADRRCDVCHVTDAWVQVSGFDHDRTRYPLRGAHQRITCGRCHKTERPGTPIRFRGLPLECADAGCHGDPHGGQFATRQRGNTCVTCHSDEHWKPVVFDHQTDSDWPLDGAHRNVPCAGCHRPSGTPPVVKYRPLPHACQDCHAAAGRRS